MSSALKSSPSTSALNALEGPESSSLLQLTKATAKVHKANVINFFFIAGYIFLFLFVKQIQGHAKSDLQHSVLQLEVTVFSVRNIRKTKTITEIDYVFICYKNAST